MWQARIEWESILTGMVLTALALVCVPARAGIALDLERPDESGGIVKGTFRDATGTGIGTAASSAASSAPAVKVISDATWRTSKVSPPAGWNSAIGFDDSDAAGWQAAFKSPSGNNIWYGSNLSSQSPNNAWFRHLFTLDGPVSAASGTVYFDDDGEFYLNGHLLVDDTGGGATSFDLASIDPGLFVVGDNLVAVHGIDTIAPYSNIGVNLSLTVTPEPAALATLALICGVPLRRRRRSGGERG